jgi:hypothetical protein
MGTTIRQKIEAGGNFLTNIMNAKNVMEAKSIAAQARSNIFMYRVALSSSIGDVNVAIAINKYIEMMNGVFTLIVSGLNVIAKDNSELKNIIKSISAESYNPDIKSIESIANKEFDEALSRLNTDYIVHENQYDAPRIGKYAKSNEEDSPVKKFFDTIDEQYDETDARNKSPSPTTVQQYSVSASFIDKLDKITSMPTILKITFIIDGEPVTVPIVIRANPIAIGSEEIKLFLESVLAGRTYHFMRYFKWKSGEISTMEYLLGTDLAKRDKQLYKSLGRNPIYIEFMKRKTHSKWNAATKSALTGEKNTIGPTSSMIVTIDDLVSATKLDASRFTKNNNLIKRIMEQTFIMCFGIVDTAMEVVTFYYLGYDQPFRYTYQELISKNSSSSKDAQLEDILLELSRKVG